MSNIPLAFIVQERWIRQANQLIYLNWPARA